MEGRRAVELGPEHLSAYQYLSDWFVQLGRDDAAIDTAREGLARFPRDPALHYKLGFALRRKGDFATAAEQLAYAAAFKPDWPEPHFHLGLTLLHLGHAADGLKSLKEAAWLAADSPVVLNQLAWTLATHPDATLRDGPEAVRLAERIWHLAGDNNPKPFSTLAAAYAEVGRFPDAINAARKAVSLARSSGDEKLAVLNQEMLRSFQSNRPYRQHPALGQ
jgi:Flp pilus assembly protein TadD